MAYDENDLDFEIPELDGEQDEGEYVLDARDIEIEVAEAEAVRAARVGGVIETPPERVRFTTPVVLGREDDNEGNDGATLNLSVRGLAVITAAELKPGERVWVELSLGLGEEPLSYLCAVIWRGRDGQAGRLYGLQFLGLTPEEETRIASVVRERSEGRAVEWSLPVMPEAQPAPPRRGPNPWVSAAAGMAAGIGLALALSVIPSSGVSGTRPEEATEADASSGYVAVTEPEQAAAPADPTAEPEEGVASANATAELEQGTTAGGAAVAPRGAQAATAGAHAVDGFDEGAAPAVASRSGVAERRPEPATRTEVVPAERSRADPAVVRGARAAEHREGSLMPRRAAQLTGGEDGDVLRPIGTADSMELALLADGPVDQHVSFWLNGPRRLVVDVFGRKSGFSRSNYTIEHPLASQLRIGQHPDKVRFVIETAADVGAEVRTRTSGSSLIVELARK